MNTALFLALIFVITFLVGKLVEKVRVPWIFAALLIGFCLAVYNPFTAVTSSETFEFLAELGMYFLLFMIGFELDINKLKKSGAFIVRSTFFIIMLEAVAGTLLVHFVFGYEWYISLLVAMSFATVGEAILLPILDEFRVVNTKLGQSIIGIGTLDDIIEVLVLVLVMIKLGGGGESQGDERLILVSLVVLLILTYALTKFKKESRKFGFLSIENLFLFVLFVFFLFVGVGEYAHASAIAALLAGVGLKNFVPQERLEFIGSEIRTMCYGFFAPIFFVWVGLSLDINYLVTYPLLVLLVVAVSNSAKLLGSYIMAKNQLGTEQSILLGIGLSVRFSTSIVIIKILYENNLIGADLYSVVVASSMVFNFIVPVLFANLLVKWKVVEK
ncbi:glutathione-regulated potassium-efflux system protein KefC [bacterium BMS3Abin10]|nr:glutathione-regulated potassium-efflux system protein KefC [bacterium BMS3Abin10]GBE37530.1 glutathione-regulated potassium-efflux system protein KefC [bacterium BMS3Bbin08]